MAPRKNKAGEEARAEAAAPTQAPPIAAAPPATVTLDRDNFFKVRDSVYARLSTIQDLIKSFSVDYLRETNLLLGEGTNIDTIGGLDQTRLGLSGLMGNLLPQGLPEKKERKKRQVDPHAPKRPLTPFFLYMQNARPIISGDLGPDAAKGAVGEEGQRRWGAMSKAEKEGWYKAYHYNLRLYNARVAAYKSGKHSNARDWTDEEARRYADDNGVPAPDFVPEVDDVVINEVPVDDALVAEPAAESEEEVTGAVEAADEEEPEPEAVPVPVPEPKPVAKNSRKGKESRRGRKAATPVVEEEEKMAAAPSSPETTKKRKRASKAEAAVVAEEPKKSARKKSKN